MFFKGTNIVLSFVFVFVHGRQHRVEHVVEQLYKKETQKFESN